MLDRGGALSFKYGILHLNQCTFTSNAAINKGGAVFVSTLNDAIMESSLFVNNSAKRGGAVSCESEHLVQFQVRNCTFERNTATICAGALNFDTTSVNISQCKLFQNVSPMAGTILFSGKSSVLRIEHSKIWKNNFEGEQKATGAAVWSPYSHKLVAHNVVFSCNNVGGMRVGATRAEIHDCFFSRNGGVVGAIDASDDTKYLIISNTSFFLEGDISMLRRTNSTILLNCKFVACGSFINPTAIQMVVTPGMVLRSSGNIFATTRKKTTQLAQAMSFFSRPTFSAVTVYLWDTWYQVNDSRLHAVDENFVHNIPTSSTTTDSHVNVTAEFSQFASGMLSTNETGKQV